VAKKLFFPLSELKVRSNMTGSGSGFPGSFQSRHGGSVRKSLGNLNIFLPVIADFIFLETVV
jgi:hypothetical protein